MFLTARRRRRDDAIISQIGGKRQRLSSSFVDEDIFEDDNSSSSDGEAAIDKTESHVLLERKKPLSSTHVCRDQNVIQLSQSILSINVLEKEIKASLNSVAASMTTSSTSSHSASLAAIIAEKAAATASSPPDGVRPIIDPRGGSAAATAPPPIPLAARELLPSKLSVQLEFFKEIRTVISSYLSLVFLQRAMNNNNNNSSCYHEGMLQKMTDIIKNIPRHEMVHEKYISVARDALYIYYVVVSKLTGPNHFKRLRTPKKQEDFCYIIAMLVNDVPIDSDLIMAGKSTSLVQFASTLSDPSYRLAVHRLSNVFNSSYSIYKALNLPQDERMRIDQTLSLLSAKNLIERKPRTLAQSVFLYYNPTKRDALRASGLTSEESSLGTAVRLVSQQLAVDNVDGDTLEDGLRLAAGHYASNNVTLKLMGCDHKDIKIIGLSSLLVSRHRKEISSISIH